MLGDKTLVCDRARLNLAVQVWRVRAKRLSAGIPENCLQTAQVPQAAGRYSAHHLPS